MSRYTAPLGFTLVAIWAAVVFAILASAPQQPVAHQTTTTHASR